MVDVSLAAAVTALFGYLAIAYLVGRLLVGFTGGLAGSLHAATAPLLGGAVLALQLWSYGSVGIPWNDLTMTGPWLLLAVIRWPTLGANLLADLRAIARECITMLRAGPAESVLTIALGLLSLTYLLNLVDQPVLGWDAIAIWLFKAKVFYLHQAVDLAPIAQDIKRNLDYPPLYPLMVDSGYTLIGHLDPVFGKAVTFLFYLSAVLGFLVAATDLLGRRLALTLAFVVAALPIFQVALFTFGQMGWADYPVGIFMLASLLHLIQGERTGDPRSRLSAVVFASLAALTKNEGLSFLIIVLLATGALQVLSSRRGERTWLRSPFRVGILLLSLFPVVAWQVYLRWQGIHGARLVGGLYGSELLPALPGRAVAILHWTRLVVAIHPDYPWLAAGLLLAVLLAALRPTRIVLVALGVVAAQMLAYFLIYLLTPFDISYIVPASLDRLVLQLAPSLILVLAIALCPYMASAQSSPKEIVVSQGPKVRGDTLQTSRDRSQAID